MLLLEQENLGHREPVSVQRDKFMLNKEHGAATALTRRLDVNGFIRADRDSLLFREASDTLRQQLEAIKPGVAIRRDNGFEVGWSAIDLSDIERMFDVVRSIVQTVSSAHT